MCIRSVTRPRSAGAIMCAEVVVMDEVLETLEGCVAILEAMEEERHDPRLYAVMAALRWAISQVEPKC